MKKPYLLWFVLGTACCFLSAENVIAEDVTELAIPTSGVVFQLYLTPSDDYSDTPYYDQNGVFHQFLGTENHIKFHHGVDISEHTGDRSKPGSLIYAAASGKVVFADIDGRYGHTVVIYHGTYTINTQEKHLYTFYGHMGNKVTEERYITVEKEDSLFAGQQIGKQGNSGFATGIHLDWEIRLGNNSPEDMSWDSSSNRSSMVVISPDFFTDQKLTHGVSGAIAQWSQISRGPFLNLSSSEFYREGLIIKSPDSPGIYLVQNGKKRVYSEQGYLQRDYSFGEGGNPPTYIVLAPEVVNSLPNGTHILEDSKDIKLKLYFKKGNLKTSEFAIGDTKDAIVEIEGDGYTVNTYLKVTAPNGVDQSYAYFPNGANQQPQDRMEFTSEQRSLTGVLWNVRDFTWPFNSYRHPENDITGTWTWEFFYEDVNRPGIPLKSTTATYRVYSSQILRIAGVFTEPPDTEPPIILSKAPSAGAASVPITVSINITFNEPMNQSATQGAFSLLRERSLVTPGTFSWDGNTLMFTPDASLSYGTEYTVFLYPEVADEAGNTIQLTEWIFTIEPAPPPPPLNLPTLTIPSFSDQKRIWIYPSPYAGSIEIASGILSDKGGGIVLVKPGEYDEWLNVFSNVLYKSIAGPAATVIKRDMTTRTRAVSNATVEGFTINAVNASSQVVSTVFIGNGSSNILVKDNVIVPIPSSQAIHVRGGASPIFIGNSISNHNSLAVYIQENSTTLWGRNHFESVNTGLEIVDSDARFFANVFQSNTNAIEIGGSSNNTIIAHNNIFIGNTTAIRISQPPQTLHVYNNVFYNDVTAISTSGTSLLTILNNVFQVTATPIWAPDVQTFDIQYNDFVGTGIGALPSGLNPASNNYADSQFQPVIQPDFVDPNVSDFRLAGNSGLIDAGHPDAVHNDLIPPGQGNARNDVGAYGGPGPYDIDNQPPTLNPVGDKSIMVGEELRFDISGFDPNGEVLLLSSRFLPAEATFSVSTFSWTPPTDQVGEHTLPFAAYDGQLADFEIITITVLPLPPKPKGSINESAHDFGSIDTGSIDSWQFSISNTGNAELTIRTLFLTASPGFEVTQSAPLAVPAGDQLPIDVTFAPTLPGIHRTTIVIETNDPAEPTLNVELEGAGSAPIVPDLALLAQPAHDFGDVLIGESKGTYFKVANAGTASLTLSILNETPLSVVPLDFTIEPGNTDSFFVEFTPTEISSLTASILLQSNDPDNNSLQLTINGRGAKQVITVGVQVPDTSATYLQTLQIPIRVTDTSEQNIDGMEFMLAYDSGVLTSVGDMAVPTDIATGWSIQKNVIPGTNGIDTLKIGMAGSILSGAGDVLGLTFETSDIRHPASTVLQLVKVIFNEQDLTATALSGSVTLVGSDASASIAASETDPENIAVISVTDIDENRNSEAIDSVQIKAFAQAHADTEIVWLKEIAPASGQFQGEINLLVNLTQSEANNALDVVGKDSMGVVYLDSLNIIGETVSRRGIASTIHPGTAGELLVTSVIQALDSKHSIRDSVRIQVVDTDPHTDAAQAGRVAVVVTNTGTNEIEHIELSEHETDSGMFRATISTIQGTNGIDDDGVLTIASGNSLIVSYEDVVSDDGSPDTLQAVVQVINLFGDLSGNGEVRAFDAARIVELETDPSQATLIDTFIADVSGDRGIFSHDADLVLQYVVDIIDRFPVQTGSVYNNESGGQNLPFSKPLVGTQVVTLGEPELLEGTTFLVPILLNERGGIRSGTLQVGFPAHVSIASVVFDEVYTGAIKAHTTYTDNVRIAFAGASAKAGPGAVVWIQLQIAGEASAALVLEEVALNGIPLPIDPRPLELVHLIEVPKAYQLIQNHPNPFNPITTIQYELPEQVSVILTIYSIVGQTVRVLVDVAQPAGFYEVMWNGQDQHGREVTSGIYFYRIQAGEFTDTKRMVFLK